MAYAIAKYLRISSEDIDLDGFDKYESNSIKNQRSLLDDFISKIPDFAGCEVIEELDDGRTGTNFSRPGVQRLIELARTGKVQCIIVKDLSRWGRNHIEVGDYLEQKFPEWGVSFISISDCYDSAVLGNGAVSGIDIGFRNLIYELYSQDLSEKVRSAKKSMAKSGKYTNAAAFYGYIKDPLDSRKLIIDPPSAKVVQRVFSLAKQNIMPTQIAKILNDEAVASPQKRKMELGYRRKWTKGDMSIWYASIVSLMLRDERYTGKLIYGKKKVAEIGKAELVNVPKSEWIVVPNVIPAIIAEEEFQLVNSKITKRNSNTLERKKPKRKLLFAKKLKCGHCGMAMQAVYLKKAIKYYCITSKVNTASKCSASEWVFENDIAKVVFTALKKQIALADKARKMLEARATQVASNIEKLHDEIAQLEQLVDKSRTDKMALWEKYHMGDVTADVFQDEIEKSDMQIQEYEAQISELQKQIISFEMETGRENVFVERFSKQVGIQELTRNIVEELIFEVKIYSTNKIEIIFNFADEYEKIAPLLNTSKRKQKRKH